MKISILASIVTQLNVRQILLTPVASTSIQFYGETKIETIIAYRLHGTVQVSSSTGAECEHHELLGGL
jgi:hypothetical protein